MKTRPRLYLVACTVILLATIVGTIRLFAQANRSDSTKLCSSAAHAQLGWIHLSEDGTRFVCAQCGRRFIAWGFNYDHDDSDRLLEDYWQEEWSTVVEDFREMKDLGANLVRVHPQLGRFMQTADKPNEAALKQLGRLVELAESTGLHLDITGLGCYHKKDVPAWYDALDEARRWKVQALFWEAVAKTCAGSDAVFCYDLMNEPVLPGGGEQRTDWLAGEFGGKHFVQRITLDLAGRTRTQVAEAWARRLVAAIRAHDKRHMITVGVIPWVLTFPKAEPLFYGSDVAKHLDFVSVHFYPKRGEVNKALTALEAYQIGKPVLIEETSPLWCSEEEFDTFIDASCESVDGYVGFYWGKTIEEYSQPGTGIRGAIMKDWLEYFRTKGPQMLDADSNGGEAPPLR